MEQGVNLRGQGFDVHRPGHVDLDDGAEADRLIELGNPLRREIGGGMGRVGRLRPLVEAPQQDVDGAAAVDLDDLRVETEQSVTLVGAVGAEIGLSSP
jgi:hypothetical protein